MRYVMWLALVLGLTGCVDGPAYFYAERITGKTFVPLNDEVGIYPNQTVLIDDANPFVGSGIGAETRWEIEASGDPVAAFYCWATLLTAIPTGEHQYYAALNLQRIYEQGRAAEEDLPLVRELAIAGYQRVLDVFPESVTFNNAGTIGFGLATPSLQGIIALGGSTRGGWTLVPDANGGLVAVQVAEVPPPAEEDE